MQRTQAGGNTSSGLKDAFAMLHPSDRRKLLFSSAILVALGFVDIFGIALIGILVSLASAGESSSPAPYVTFFLKHAKIDDVEFTLQVLILGITATLLFVFKSITALYILRRIAHFLSKRGAEISKVFISKLLSSSIADLRIKSIQESLYAVTSGVSGIMQGVVNRCIVMVVDASTFVFIIVALIFIDSLIAILSTSIFGFISLTLFFQLRRRAREEGALQAKVNIRQNQEVLEVLGSFREIFVKNRSNFYSEKIGRTRFALADSQAQLSFMNVFSKYVMDTSVTVGALLVAVVQLYFFGGPEAIASLGLFLAAGLRLAPAVLRLQQSAVEVKAEIAKSEPTRSLFLRLRNSNSSVASIQTESVEYAGFRPNVRFDDVSFSYESNGPLTLNSVEFFVPEGSFCAIVGESGAGKSTLVDLMLGITKQDKGFVSISGLSPVDAISKWPGAIGYVPQDVQIVQGTIRDNIALGYSVEMFPESMMWEALEVAQLSDFVRSKALGLDSPVGDRGTKLSGGQKQRLGIARAMFTKPQLLILDEATSALDPKTESEFLRALLKSKGASTLIVIAHRLSTVSDATVVYRIHEGHVTEADKDMLR
jgi:ABC-type multidrug transport system fused ATPase/permease subunit